MVARDVRESLQASALLAEYGSQQVFYIHFLICTGCKLWFTVQLTSSGDSGDRKTAWKTGNKKSEEFDVPER